MPQIAFMETSLLRDDPPRRVVRELHEFPSIVIVPFHLSVRELVQHAVGGRVVVHQLHHVRVREPVGRARPGAIHGLDVSVGEADDGGAVAPLLLSSPVRVHGDSGAVRRDLAVSERGGTAERTFGGRGGLSSIQKIGGLFGTVGGNGSQRFAKDSKRTWVVAPPLGSTSMG